MIERVCMHDTCKNNVYLTSYKCKTDRPFIYLGRACWNYHSSEFLVDKK